MAVAGIAALIPLLGNTVASFLTTWTGSLSWMVTPVIAVLVAMATTLLQAVGKRTRTAPEAPAGHAPAVPGRTDVGVPKALLVILLVVGGGAAALTFGVRYVVGYITGNEPGTEILVEPVGAAEGGLRLDVESVESTAHFTRLEVVAHNDTGTSVTLPLFKTAQLVGGDGTTLEADPFRSRWADTVAPGGVLRGTITFPGHLGDDVLTARFGFTHRFAFGGSSEPLFVEGIRLRRR